MARTRPTSSSIHGAGAQPVWRAAPGTSDWNTGTNWETNTVPTPTDIAQFNASTITTIDIQQLGTQVGALQFNAGAPAYTFNITGTSGGPSSLILSGNGVADISGNAPTFLVSGIAGALGTLQFNNVEHRGRRHHQHQCFRADDFHRQQHRRARPLHHQCRRRGGLFRDQRLRRQ